jgi:hypothetical protein
MAPGADAMDNVSQAKGSPECLHGACVRSHLYHRPIVDGIAIGDDAIAVGTVCPSLSTNFAPIASSSLETENLRGYHLTKSVSIERESEVKKLARFGQID